MERENLTGKTFGRLTVVEFDHSKDKKSYWKCKCICGNITISRSDQLKNGQTKSCGCLKKETDKINFSKRNFHYKSHTRIHKIWLGMKDRCFNSKTPAYKWYGLKGVIVCEEWKNDFMQFYNWAMANGYNDTLTIDRIDTNGNYEPNNCSWTTMIEQANNTTRNHFLTYNNETHTIMEWVRKTGLSRSAIRGRLKRGWSIEKTLTTPVMADSIQILTPKE
jgi:hypothetical protein